MHVLGETIEDAIFQQELVESHEIVGALAAFGGLAVEDDDFF